MTRLYHSPSSTATGRRCERAWFYQYVAGIRDQRVEWENISHYVWDANADSTGTRWWRDPYGRTAPVKARQRSSALGVAMHERLEGWYTGQPVEWHDLPGVIAQSGLHLLPHPTRSTAHVESPVGDAAIVGAAEAHAPPVGFRIAGITWAGYRDLVTHAPEEMARLRLPGDWGLFDYKSSADIARYALKPAELATDVQANLYALATMTELGLDRLSARWVYFEAKAVRRAEPRDVVITRSSATDVMLESSELARHLDVIRLESDAVPNPMACGDYGGCPHHHSVGGPCDARRSFGAMAQARTKKKEAPKMALPPGIQNRFPAAAAPATAATAPPPAVEAPPVVAAAPAPAAAPPPEPVAAAPKAERKPKAAPSVAAAQPAAVAPAPAAIDTGDTDTFEIPGNFGMLVLSGHAKDVLAAAKILMRAP